MASYGIPRPDLPAEKLAKMVEREQLLQGNGYDLISHAGKLGIPYDIFMARLEVARQMREKKHGKDLVEWSLGTPWRLEGDWMIIGDVHVPYTDYEFSQLVALVARKNMSKPRRLLIAGDFFNMDTFSNYIHLVNIPTWKEERDAAKTLLHEWLETFDEIRMLMGNHDRRLQKFVNGEFDETDILSLVISNPDMVKMSAPPYPDKKPDCTKLLRALEDSLTGIIWKDDCQIVEQHVSKVYSPNPGAKVFVTMKGSEPQR